VNAAGVPVRHTNPDASVKMIPMPSLTIVYETLNNPPATYLSPEDLGTRQFPLGSVVIPMERDGNIAGRLEARGLHSDRTHPEFVIYTME